MTVFQNIESFQMLIMHPIYMYWSK